MSQSEFLHGHALLIGVGGDLPSTIADATGLADVLTDPERCAYPEGQVTLLTGEEANRAGILAGLDALAQRSDAASTVIVYFSGHGCRVESPLGELHFLQPHGYDQKRLAQTCIRGDEFAAKLAAIPARKLLLLLDCCHAGGVGQVKSPEFTLSKAPLPPEALALLAQGQGKVLIASSTADELSYAGKPYSAFTLALLEALCGDGASVQDGYIRVADLALHAREKVPLRTSGNQHPLLHFEHADNFIVAYYAGGDLQPKGLPFPVESVEIEPQPGVFNRSIHQSGQRVEGNQQNITGSVTGSVAGGDVEQVGDRTDLRGSTGTVVKPSGPVKQYNTNIRSARGLAIGDNAQVHVHGTGAESDVESDESPG